MKKLTATELYALVFGGFLGVCIWKFGNPVILDHVIQTPQSWNDFWYDAWPIHWANGFLLVLSLWAGGIVLQKKRCSTLPKLLWLLPVIWLGWQFISALQTVDATLTALTLWQFSGCVACYFIGAFIIGFPRTSVGLEPSKPAASKFVELGTSRAIYLLLIGLLVAFAFCLVRGANQKLFDFPLNYQLLVEGERSGWTNYPPETVLEMKAEKIIVYTNDMAVANPVILEKFRKARVAGSMVYPNALAGLLLLLFPVSIALAIRKTGAFKRPTRLALIALTIALGSTVFFWTGSKLGWLIGIGLMGYYLMLLKFPRKYKLIAVMAVLVIGFGVFTVRFHQYFAKGATSLGARFDYWQAALKITAAKPAFGSGPGTFQRPYERLKAPESEMARLAHNDFLEQFSDSGVIAGLIYLSWVGLNLLLLGRKATQSGDLIYQTLFMGTAAWFIQGLGEFGLYIPASAWIAFTLLGCLSADLRIKLDKNKASG